jgi:hypothetical protein
LRFGLLNIVPQSIREIQNLAVIAAPEEPAEEDQVTSPRCELLGENRITGVIDLPELHLATDTSVTPVETRQILQVEMETEAGGERTASIKLIGGQELKGRLTETVLPIRAKDRVWRVPTVHLVAVRQPVPEAAPPGEPPKPDAPQNETSTGSAVKTP